MDRRLLIFPHCPKAGGTSLDRGLKAIFGERVRRLGMGEEQAALEALPSEQRAELAAVTGHFTFDYAEAHLVPLLSARPHYLATVRDPVERERSAYSYIRQKYATDEERSKKLHVTYDDDIDVYVANRLDRPKQHNNPQCRYVCGSASAAAAIRCIEARYLGAVTPPRIALLLGRIAASAGAPAPPPLHLKASQSERFPIRPDLADELRALNTEDQTLFEWVNARHDGAWLNL